MKKDFKILKENYLKETSLGNVIPLENISTGIDIVKAIENWLDEDSSNKFEIELIMMPS